MADEQNIGGYGRGARVLSLGIAATGVLTLLFFALAGHALPDKAQVGRISALWSLLFIMMSVFYRPVEQLLSRTIADRRARGLTSGHPLTRPLLIQAAFAATFLIVCFALRAPIERHVLGGHGALFWVMVGAATAYAASYFARGYLAGHQWFGLYGGLVLFEASARVLFPLAALVGVASGETFVALGILAAPLASLLMIPWALGRHHRTQPGAAAMNIAEGELGSSSAFAGSVAAIQLGEQTLLNMAVLLLADPTTRGVVFMALLISRAPLQLFQVIQTSLLPHLAGLEVAEGHAAFARAIRTTVAAIAAFATAVTVGLLAIGPWALHVFFAQPQDYYDRWLALIGVGMGLHLIAGTFTQAALARGRAHQAAAAWLLAAGGFVLWMVLAPIASGMHRTEIGYALACGLLCALLYAIYRLGPARRAGTRHS